MERRHFLKLAVGVAVGAAALAASAQAAPLSPQPIARDDRLPGAKNEDVHAAVTSQAEVENLKPEQVRWGHHWHGHHWDWHHRHWGWHRRHWGWHHRHGAGTTVAGTAVTGRARLPLTGRRIFCTSPKSPRRGKSERKGKRL